MHPVKWSPLKPQSNLQAYIGVPAFWLSVAFFGFFVALPLGIKMALWILN